MSEKTTFSILIDRIAEKTGESKETSHTIVKELVEIIDGGLLRDGHVRLKGLGAFNLKKVADRRGVNPRTGERIDIPAHTKITYKPDQKIKLALNPQDKPEPEKKRSDEQNPILALWSGNKVFKYGSIAIVALLFLIFGLTRTAKENAQNVQVAETAIAPEDVSPPAPEPPAAEQPAEGETAPAPPAPEPEKVKPEPVEPIYIWHTMAAGENLWSLAKKYYGNPYLWPLIYQSNADVITNPDLVSANKKIRVPGLLGTVDNLASSDREKLAAGNVLVHKAYTELGLATADDFIAVALNLDPAVFDKYNLPRHEPKLLTTTSEG